MSEHFNKLTPAEAERLALLSEEMGEAQQAIGKILRHGYESHNPDKHAGPSNRRDLEQELGDAKHATERMVLAGDLCARLINVSAADKQIKVERYLHHQEQSQ